jgi:Rho GDP-dissociation inhibitor
MSNKHDEPTDVIEGDELSKYVPPKNVPISEIMQKDSEDAALNKYKQQLIGSAINVTIEPTDPRKLLLKRLVLVPDDHAEISFDLTLNSLAIYKEKTFRLREGCSYRVKLEFYVQRDIVSGLKFVQTTYKGPIRTDKSSYMLGSRAPKGELQEYLSEKEIAPSGMMARGKYHMKSHIIDDDKNVFAKWEWTLEISKEW